MPGATESVKFDPFLCHGDNDPPTHHDASKTQVKGATATATTTQTRATKLGTRTANATKTAAKGASRNPVDAVLLILAPWLTFVGVLALFFFVKYLLPRITWLVLVVVFVLFAAMIAAGAQSTRKSLLYCGVMCIFATVLASLLGLHHYSSTSVHVWWLVYGNSFTNVLPSEGARGYSDAGKVLFAEEARIDSSKAMGYKEGVMYCVAPILDDSDISEIEFWAVGQDCCSARGYFSCDDSWDSQARAGVVIHAADELMPDVYDHYMKAVKQAQAAFDVESVSAPLFVRWVHDPEKLLEEWIRFSITVHAVAIAIHLVFSIITGIILSAPTKPRD